MGGAAVFLYPAVSNYLAEKNQTRVIQTYQEAVGGLSDEELSEEWAKAEEYNENLTGDPVHDPFVPGSGYALPDNYLDVLNTDGVMCYIEIPKIDVSLPVYHGTAEETLEKGVGHMESTTLPIGGAGRHAVLTGHRGLPSAELFTNLDLLEIGDHFYINVLGETLAYEVDRIEVVEPDELELLAAEPGRGPGDSDHVHSLRCQYPPTACEGREDGVCAGRGAAGSIRSGRADGQYFVHSCRYHSRASVTGAGAALLFHLEKAQERGRAEDG